MCNPMAIMASAMAVGTGAQMYGQREQYKAQAEQAAAQNRMYIQNRENAFRALGRQYGDIGERQSQEQQRAVEDKEQRTREARAQMATARVAAGEAGITGNSVRLGMRDISGAASRDRSTIDRNLDWTLSQLQRQKSGAKTSTINRINSVQTSQGPSKGAYYAGQASTLANGVTQATSMKPQNNSYGSSSASSYSGSGWANSATR